MRAAALLLVVAFAALAAGETLYVAARGFKTLSGVAIGGAQFRGSVMSLAGDTFGVVFFDQDNYLAWQASKRAYCYNPSCNATIAGREWTFTYLYPSDGNYYLVLYCANVLETCVLTVDVTWNKLDLIQWLPLIGVVCAALLLIFIVCYCMYHCCCRKRQTAQVPHQEMSPLSTTDDVEA